MNTQDSLMAAILDAINRKGTDIKLKHMSNVVLFIGTSGNGTSTLVQFLSGNQFLFSKGEEGRYFIIDKEDRIGDPTKTTLTRTVEVEPVWFNGLDRETCYFDCPGFGNTISARADILSTIATRNALQDRNSAKIILVVSYQEVKTGGQRNAFLDLVQYLTEFLKDIKKFKDSIALIVTKVPNIVVVDNGTRQLVPDENIKESIVEFLDNVRSVIKDSKNVPSEKRECFKNALTLVDMLLNDPEKKCSASKIGIFRSPETSGMLNTIETFQTSAKSLNDLIKNNITFTPINIKDFGYTVSATSKASLCDEVQEIVDEFRLHLTYIFKIFQMDYQGVEKTPEADLVRKLFIFHDKIWQKAVNELNGLSSTFGVFKCFLALVEELLETDVFKKHKIEQEKRIETPKTVKQPEVTLQNNCVQEVDLSKDFYADITEANKVIQVLKRKLLEAQGEDIPKSATKSKPHKSLSLYERIEKLHECIRFMNLLQTVIGGKLQHSTVKLQTPFKKLADYVRNTKTWYDMILPTIFDQLCSCETQAARSGERVTKFMETLRKWSQQGDDTVITSKQLREASSNGIGIPIEIETNATKLKHLIKICETVFEKGIYVLINDGRCLRLTGTCVFLSSAARLLNSHQSVSEIEIFASARIFIDCDLNLTGKRVQLFVAAPKWEVFGGKRQIILDGQLPGPYQMVCSGSFFGIGEQILNYHNLKISTCACNDETYTEERRNEQHAGRITTMYNTGQNIIFGKDNQPKPLNGGFHAGLSLLVGCDMTALSSLTQWNSTQIRGTINCHCNFKNYRIPIGEFDTWLQTQPLPYVTDAAFKQFLNTISSSKSCENEANLVTQHIDIMEQLKDRQSRSSLRAANSVLLYDILYLMARPGAIAENKRKVLCCLFAISAFQHYSNFFDLYSDPSVATIQNLSKYCLDFLSFPYTEFEDSILNSYKVTFEKICMNIGSYENLYHLIAPLLYSRSSIISQNLLRESINYFGILLRRKSSR